MLCFENEHIPDIQVGSDDEDEIDDNFLGEYFFLDLQHNSQDTISLI